MARKNIGILLLGGTDWVGGLYYVLNIIKSLDALDDAHQPNLVVFAGNPTAWQEMEQVHYPHLLTVNFHPSLPAKVWNRLLANITGKDFHTARLCKKYALDALYPYNYPYLVPAPTKVMAWFPDFQHKYLPQLFSAKEITQRDLFFQRLKNGHLVLSSQDASDHYAAHFSHLNIRLHQLPFVSNLDAHSLPDQKSILDQFRISREYFIVSNQFWEHKNHLVVFKAIASLRERYPQLLVVFTGKETDYRNPRYFEGIRQFVKDHQLGANTLFLGFISRQDQLALMKYARAIIQPSKFEGWGTVVEDAKSLNKQVIASDIPVHHEQLENHAYYFNPDQPEMLATLMASSLDGLLPDIHSYASLQERKKIFALQFIEIMTGHPVHHPIATMAE